MPYIEEMLDLIESGDLEYRGRATEEIMKWRAFRYNNRTVIQAMRPWRAGRPYRIDPLPKRISMAFSDFLFGEDPFVKPAAEGDLQQLKDILQNINFTQRCRIGEDICVSEGRVYWKIYSNTAEMAFPQVEFYSRADVIPYTSGDKILAIAFVTEFPSSVQGKPTYYLLECHEGGRVVNVLYEGEVESETDRTQSEKTRISNQAEESTSQGTDLGRRVPLTEFARTQNLAEEWNHGLMDGEEPVILAGEVKNEEYAESVYDGIEDFFLDLNEAHTVDAENFRLAGKKRAVMDEKYANQAGEADHGEEIFWVKNDMAELDGDQAPFKVMEYSYDGTGSVARKDDLEQRALTRVGLARQLVDANANEGLAQTGTALKTRLLPTVAAIKGKAREWQGKLPRIVQLLMRVDNLPEGDLGFGRSYSELEILPSVTLAAPLPVDVQEEALRHQTLVNAELESIETAIEELHPGWSKDRRDLEVRRILANRAGYALDDDGNPIRAEETPSPTGSNTGGNTEEESEEEEEEARPTAAPPEEEGVTSSNPPRPV